MEVYGPSGWEGNKDPKIGIMDQIPKGVASAFIISMFVKEVGAMTENGLGRAEEGEESSEEIL